MPQIFHLSFNYFLFIEALCNDWSLAPVYLTIPVWVFLEQLKLFLMDNFLMGHIHRFNEAQTSTELLQSFEEI